MKKIDTHVHTSEVSSCGKLTASQIVESYVAAGYDAVSYTHLDVYKRQSKVRQMTGVKS